MEIQEIKVLGKVCKVYFSMCTNCKKYIVHAKEDIVVCSNCKKKYKVQYAEQ